MQNLSLPNLFRLLRSDGSSRDTRLHDGHCDFPRDPLAHPDIAAMSERELGDLPLGQLRLRWRS